MTSTYTEQDIKALSSREGHYRVRACEQAGRSIVEYFEGAFDDLEKLSLEGRARRDQVEDLISELRRSHPTVSFYMAYKFQLGLVKSQYECQNRPEYWSRYVQDVSKLKKPIDFRSYGYLVSSLNDILGNDAKDTLRRAAVEYNRPEFVNVKLQTPETIIEATGRVYQINMALKHAPVSDLKKQLRARRPSLK